MLRKNPEGRIVHVGDRRGLGTVYNLAGDLLLLPGESILKSVANWDIDILSPWRRTMPHVVFPGFHGRASSMLYVTSHRIVLIRDIDEWRELAGELTPLGLPNAAAKERVLSALRKTGARQFCEIFPYALRVVSTRRFLKRGSMIDLKLIGDDNHQYAVLIWKTDGRDPDTIDILESRFRHGQHQKQQTG